ncbi:histidine kinase [Massilia sp. Root351]|jgi:nitrogen fixation/metabolism regulation signal transduction histidine kinase|uniref:sensor histidine kinase n=1 Tax=Massilia sp. Root351 TaxID=1736522 RepID=UPI00070F071F|nr:ATP-binding protein [Massilia sp. Root351]KQV85882.1 histidine kinase [Massilia sp. Root351]
MLSLRRRLQLYLAALHALLLAAVLLHYRSQPLLFIGLEALLLASWLLGLRLIRQALEPLDYTQRFQGLLQDQDYAARLRTQPGGREEKGELGELVGLFNSMLDALYQERLRLGEQRGFLDRLLEATPSAVVVFDFDGHISLINPSAGALLGLDAPLGKPLRAWLDGGADATSAAATGSAAVAATSAARARARSLLEQLDALPLGASRLLSDADGRRYRGQRGHFHDRGFARQFLLIDELTAELADSEHATYDKMIRVLGHEVNNTVAATGSVLESLLYYRSQLAERDADDFSTAIVAVKRRNVRLGEFIERFTRVVKMPAPELRPAAIGAILDDIVSLYREPCRSRGIELAWIRRDQVPALPMDSQLMEQALLNLVKNAMEAVAAAMQEHGLPDGHVHLSLAAEDGRGGAGARLSIIDSGDRLGGVPASQLFTPFFTTKKGGQGIGLLFAREVLNRHGYAHKLAATGQGETSFDIWLTPS